MQRLCSSRNTGWELGRDELVVEKATRNSLYDPNCRFGSYTKAAASGLCVSSLVTKKALSAFRVSTARFHDSISIGPRLEDGRGKFPTYAHQLTPLSLPVRCNLSWRPCVYSFEQVASSPLAFVLFFHAPNTLFSHDSRLCRS
ncbi:hypothetical protein BDW22DRAFT_852288 [Trametopsis cervina]|nr:hypothetical protein BDW22DRAFT_852288 [Trametopsis cervina]